MSVPHVVCLTGCYGVFQSITPADQTRLLVLSVTSDARVIHASGSSQVAFFADQPYIFEMVGQSIRTGLSHVGLSLDRFQPALGSRELPHVITTELVQARSMDLHLRPDTPLLLLTTQSPMLWFDSDLHFWFEISEKRLRGLADLLFRP